MKLYINKYFVSAYLLLTFFSAPLLFSDAGTYYNSISTSSPSFVTDLEGRIRSPYTRISYDSFDETNIANYASVNNGNGTRSVICVYTGYEYIYSGVFSWGTMSREHTFAHSWMPTFPSTSVDQYSDQYQLFPTHQNNANGRRSNHPFGIVTNVTYQFLNGKVGTNNLGQIVYEPRDEQKGDAARALLYMCIRYDGISGYNWDFNWLNGTKLPSLGEAAQDLNLLLDWCRQDPPDKWEIERTDYIQSIQQNRNPFTDHPEYMNYINFNDLTKLNPVFSTEPTNYFTGFSSLTTGNSIQLSWNDAAGAQLPSDYFIIAFYNNNYFLPIDGNVINNDTSLSDRYACVNVSHSASNIYTFQNLQPNKTYYFSAYSYNGSGVQINYKIDGAFPQTNSYVPGALAAEPTNHITNISNGSITTSSVQLNWTDALPGTQTPSGYLIVANNNNSFLDPSDGTTYNDDLNLADGYAAVNVNYNSPDTYTFNGLFSNTNYYFRIYSYNGSGTLINYKTDATIPNTNATTSGALNNYSSVLLDNFNRINSNSLGNTLSPNIMPWHETETVNSTSITLSSNKIKSASTSAGREFAFVNAGNLNNYPVQFSNSSSELVWAVNLKSTRTDPSGFDNSNYGIAFILGKTDSNVTTGNGYAVVLGQSGSADAVRLARFTGGLNANSKFTNIISGGDYANQYLSIKVVYNPTGNVWHLYVDSSSAGFPQSSPANTQTQIGTASDNFYTSSSLPYFGALWNHATGASDSAIFDDFDIPGNISTTLNLTAVIEGYYNPVSVSMNMRDSIKVYLRNSFSPYSVFDSSKSVIDSLTFSGSFIFSNVTTGNYYIELSHRNSIETWSKLPKSVTSGGTFSYNFSDSVSKAYGDNMIFNINRYCLYSGDVNSDGIIDVSDLSSIDNDINNSNSGYIPTDLNGDYFVDASDGSIADNNVVNSIALIRP
ncbi:MAG: endonuclease [Ignavibacteria bacterium]|nr:endonuclease [Ignavibacteria bacterium]